VPIINNRKDKFMDEEFNRESKIIEVPEVEPMEMPEIPPMDFRFVDPMPPLPNEFSI
jgi:hypothetical protein